jgi:glycolate oxidase FAD binding subunit
MVLYDLSIEAVSEFLKNVSQSSNDITGAVHLPIVNIAKNFEINTESVFKLNDLKSASSYTAIRLEGSQISIKEKMENIKKELNLFDTKLSVLESYQSKLFWEKIKNLEIFSNTRNSVLRIIVPPSNLVKTVYYLEKLTSQYFIDWGGNLLWAEVKNLSKENLIVLKKFISNSDGYITLIKSGEGLNFYDQSFTTNKIHYNVSQKIKESFDPKRILNPNKMYSGI